MAPTTGIVAKIVSDFSAEFRGAMDTQLLTREHISTTNHNYMNETHSLVVSLLAKACFRGSPEYICILGHGLRTKDDKGGRKFVPDVTLWTLNGGQKRLFGVIEYESTNSSDSRVITKDLENYSEFVKHHDDSPGFWLIITTLPSSGLMRKDWYSWDLRDGRISAVEYQDMIGNPAAFWFDRYRTEQRRLNQASGRCPFYLMNLVESGLAEILP